jgi:Transposase zinc-binding domain
VLRLALARSQAAAGAPAGIGPRRATRGTRRSARCCTRWCKAHYPDFIARLEAEDRSVPAYVREEFEGYLRCGVLEHGFLRVVCGQCHAERLVAFSCNKRGICPSCGALRMAQSARHLVEEVFGARPVRQWVLSLSVSVALAVRQQARRHPPGAGHRTARDRGLVGG